MRNLFKILALALAATMAQSCFIDGEITFIGYIFFGFLAIFVIAFIMVMWVSKNEEAEKEKRRQAARLKRQEEQRVLELKIAQYEHDRKELAAEMGEPDKTIAIKDYDLNAEIRVYASQKKVVILGTEYDFSAILQCQFTDNARVEKGETTRVSDGTTKTNTGSMIGRAVVGGAIAGGAGALIGGSTASKGTTMTSVVKQGADVTKHDYTVWIYVKDIVNPMIQMHIGRDGAKVNEIVALMNAIMTL